MLTPPSPPHRSTGEGYVFVVDVVVCGDGGSGGCILSQSVSQGPVC